MTEREAAYILNHAAKYSKGEILDALRDSDKSSREYWTNYCEKPRGATGDLKQNLNAIKQAIGGKE